MEKPKESHETAIKHILRYLKGTMMTSLKYGVGGDEQLVDYSDNSFGDDREGRKGTTRTIFYFSALALMKNPVFHGRSKHIDTKYHFIRECVDEGLIEVEFVSGKEQKADFLTKPLPSIKFNEMKKMVGMLEPALARQGENEG
uniref:uncharacterized protein LOC122610203 n=1 Tax=Erigeron canadensis TaxID=72917 RepID=UPI001CB96A6E|nr:uncharacterized protein LOC122610203 [Erigeron canadensis]